MHPLKFFPICLMLLTFKTLPTFAAQQQERINFLRKLNIKSKDFTAENAQNSQLQTSSLEQFSNMFHSMRMFLNQELKRDQKAVYQYNKNKGRLQRKVKESQKFPCQLNNTRSPEPPTSVHRLRPGDIDIIGAMGDSITAGTAMLAKNNFQLLIEFRGKTFLGGGMETWRSSLTLPNILKVFSPNLYGYATDNTLAKYYSACFNVAESFAATQDMPYMAQVLVKRLQSDPKVDMKKHWKLISMLIGANDVCSDMCYYDNIEDFIQNHRKDLYKTLKILKDNIPRLLVNIVPVPNIENTVRLMNKLPPICDYIHRIACHCIINDSLSSKQLQNISHIIGRLQDVDQEVSALPEFQTDDFAVVPQTFTVNLALRNLTNGDTDLRFFAGDCFHFSQYGNAALANMVWNNMLQTKEKKDSTFLRPFERFECPTEEKPYILTLRNS